MGKPLISPVQKKKTQESMTDFLLLSAVWRHVQIEEQVGGKWDAENGKSGPGFHLHQWGRKTGCSHPYQRGGTLFYHTHSSVLHVISVLMYLFLFFYFDKVSFMLTGNVFFQIITKEAEVSDWKKKYEDCRKEVDEMRLEIWEATTMRVVA